jgi:hypothetical protein
MPGRSYLVPAYPAPNAMLAGFLREAASEGESWLATQKPASEWEAIITKLSASLPGNDLLGQSNAEYNKSERLARELVAALGAFSHVGEFKPEVSQDLYGKAGHLTKLDHNWFHLEQTYAAMRALLQHAICLGTGYGWQTWDKHFHGEYKGDIRLVALPPQNVTFVQLPSDHDIQRAYITLVREELPINLAKRIYARTNRAFADALVPDRDAPSWVSKGLRKVQEFLSPALRVRGMRPGQTDDASFPVVDIYHAYILDGSINESGADIPMGVPGTNWSYTVPYYGKPLPTSLINPATGQPWTRPADYADALLFPLRRHCIFARSTDIVCYDGTAQAWHGQTPVVRLAFNDWPWEALGRSCIGMIRTIEDSMSAIMQGIEDSIAARLDPLAIYNDQAISKTGAEAINPRKGGVRIAADFNSGDLIKFPITPQQYDVPLWIVDWWKYMDDRCEYLTGARDLTAVAKAKQLPSGDSMEKLLEMAGPLTQDMVRAMVLPLQQLGTMRLSDYLQYYTYERIVQTTNDEGEPQDWLFKPDLLVDLQPGDMPDVRTRKAKQLLSAFKYRVTQSGITEINRMTTKLFFLQLMKIPGFPMDWWTFAKVAQLPRFGKVPTKLDADGNPTTEAYDSMIERFFAQMQLMAEAQQKYGAPPNGQPPGRPNSNKVAPHLENKSGGTRSTNSTSR